MRIPPPHPPLGPGDLPRKNPFRSPKKKSGPAPDFKPNLDKAITDKKNRLVANPDGSFKLEKNSMTLREFTKQALESSAQFMREGKSNEKGAPKKYDAKQMAMGMKIEVEHSKDTAIRKKISADHLSEKKNSRYYDILRIGERFNDRISHLSRDKQNNALRSLARNSSELVRRDK